MWANWRFPALVIAGMIAIVFWATSYRLADTMMWILHLVARLTIAVGFVFILGKTVPRNKVFRYPFLFVMFVALGVLIDYVDVRMAGYHKIGWTETRIIALLCAAWGTFWPPQPRNSNS